MPDSLRGRPKLPLFPAPYRAAGVLLHVTSLPSRYGIGDFGPSALSWIDRLHEAGLGWWQSLPLGPTGYGDSPYQALSSFAGNGLLISPDWLVEDGLLEPSDLADCSFPEGVVDYGAVIAFKHGLLERVWRRFASRGQPDQIAAFHQFCHEQADWLDDYALFRALKVSHHGVHYLDWPAPLVRRDPGAMAQARRDLASRVDAVRLAQFLLFQHARRVMDYARDKNVRLIGDMPFVVSPDSSDVWAHPELFLLDAQRRPVVVAGVPPDYFSAKGQLWGNPVFDWEAHRRTGYRWCIERFRALLAYVDVIRLDHFRGYAAAWHVPAGAATAKKGEWVPGPGAGIFEAVEKELGGLPFIAEDLGVITPDVSALRDRFHLPGTRVLQFAFDGNPDNPFLPHAYNHNTVVYTGTHDNNTTRGWYEELPADQRQQLWHYLGRRGGDGVEAVEELIRLAMSSVAALVMIPAQDLLHLGAEARMNIPGRAEGNWRWRCTPSMLATDAFERLEAVVRASNRSAAHAARLKMANGL